MLFKAYFVDNLLPTDALQGLTTEAGINAFEGKHIWIDVANGSIRVGCDYLLGSLKGNPSRAPVTVDFDKNPDFYTGSVSVRVRAAEILAGMQTFGVFGGILGMIDDQLERTWSRSSHHQEGYRSATDVLISNFF